METAPVDVDFEAVEIEDEVTEAADAKALAKLAAAGVFPNQNGLFWHRDVTGAFPLRRGRPPFAGAKYDPDVEDGGIPRLKHRAPTHQEVQLLANLVLQSSRPVSVKRLATAEATARSRNPREPWRSAGFYERLFLALTMLDNEHVSAFSRIEDQRRIASEWRRALPRRKAY